MLRRSSFALAVTLAVAASSLAAVSAYAQTSSIEVAPFRIEWVLLAGAGESVGAGTHADREEAFQAIEWGRLVTGEHGPACCEDGSSWFSS